MSPGQSPAILVQGTADWNQPIATNQHYMVRELARAFPVTFVESLGLRRPEFSRSDMRRVISRFSSRKPSTARRDIPDGVDVLSPTVVPIHAAPWTFLNRSILNRQFRSWSAHLGPRIYWTYSPVTYGFEDLADVSIYHCVDLYGQYPGIDAALIDQAEKRLARSGIQAIGSSEVVVAHLRSQGFANVIYWPNVADTAEIQKVADASGPFTRTGALFAGNLSAKKVDFALLKALLDSGVNVNLAGPVDEGGSGARELVDELIAAGCTYHGVLDLEALSAVMLRCKVGLIPYQINGYTNGVSPLKTYEYLAAGLSVVSTTLPGVVPVAGHVATAESATEFVEKVTAACGGWNEGQLAERSALAHKHSWTGRGVEARDLVLGLLTTVGQDS